MYKRLIPAALFVAYCAILIKVMVFKDLPTIHVGQLMLNFAGTDSGHGPNFIPFTTIVPYLFGYKGLIIAGINIVGNIILLVPIGFLLPLVYRAMTWRKALMFAVLSGLTIEILQTVLRVGIFDIDDVILNALGFMTGYAALVLFARWLRERNYTAIVVVAVGLVAVAAAFYGLVVYPISHQPITPDVRPQGGDLCGGTGGNGQIVSIGSNSFVMRIKSSTDQTVTLSEQATIKTSAGFVPLSDLKVGNRVTLVGGPNPDGSFTADYVFVCRQ